jgi:hypothetical protein
MNYELKELIIEMDLENCFTVQRTDVSYLGGRIVYFQTHWPDGGLLRHSNGDSYGLAFLNAFTKKSFDAITNELKKYPAVSIDHLREFIESHRLREYIHGHTVRYKNTKTGDLGEIHLLNSEVNKAKFTNRSAQQRDFERIN